jgi:ribosomal protein L21E
MDILTKTVTLSGGQKIELTVRLNYRIEKRIGGKRTHLVSGKVVGCSKNTFSVTCESKELEKNISGTINHFENLFNNDVSDEISLLNKLGFE